MVVVLAVVDSAVAGWVVAALAVVVSAAALAVVVSAAALAVVVSAAAELFPPAGL